MIEDIGKAVSKVITDPIMLFSLLLIGGLFYLLIVRERIQKEIFTALKEQNTILCGMVPLLEVLVYGKGGKKP